MAFLRNYFGKIIDWAASAAMVIMTFLVFAQVVSRYVFNSPIPWTEEMSRIFFIWISLIGTYLGIKTKGHVSIETFVHFAFKEQTRKYISAIVSFSILYFSVYFTVMGVLMMQRTTHNLTPVMLIPFTYLYLSFAIAGALIVIYLLYEIFHMDGKRIVIAFLASLVIFGGIYLIFGRGGYSSEQLLSVALVLIALFILFGMPIGFAIAIASTSFLVLYKDVPMAITHTRIFGGIDSFPLLAVPFFVLAGELMNIGGVTSRLVNLAKMLVGHVRGGLGMACVVGEYFFSGISGSTIADVSAIASLLTPAMRKAGYTQATSASIISAATSMGILVPPCILMVVLGGMTGISVGALFLGGFIPAIVMSLCIMVLIYFQALRSKIPIEARTPWKEVLLAAAKAIVPLMLPVIIMAGILFGAATATEISVIAVLYSFIVGKYLYKEIKWSDMIPILTRTTIMTGSVMFLVGTASIMSWVLSANQIPQMFGDLIVSISSSPFVFLLLCNLCFILMGCVLEGMPAMLILVPILLPLCPQFGVSELHFGILVIASIGIGLFLPPLGMGIYVACAFAEIDIGKIFVPFFPYLVCLIIGLVIITYFPWFTMVLPNMFYK